MVDDLSSHRIADLVVLAVDAEWREGGFDAGRIGQSQGPVRMIDQVRGHVSDRAGAPSHPAAPLERVIARVIRHFGPGAEEEIPVQSLWNWIIAVHRGRQRLVDMTSVPLGSTRRWRPRW